MAKSKTETKKDFYTDHPTKKRVSIIVNRSDYEALELIESEKGISVNRNIDLGIKYQISINPIPPKK